MPATTPLGIPYPLETDDTDPPADMQAMAEEVNTLLTPLASATSRATANAVIVAQEKVVSIAPGSGSQVAWAITGWQTAPVVTITLLSQFNWIFRLAGVTATQINAYIETPDGTALPDNAAVDLHVVAVGVPASATVMPTI